MSKYLFSFATWQPGHPPLGAGYLPRLSLEPTMSGSGLFDGAWWPRSNDIALELPDLITALSLRLGRIRRVALDTAAWGDVPRSIAANGDTVRIGWLATSTGTITLSRGIDDHHILLVVPPATAWHTAAAAMAVAATTGNRTPADELLDFDGGSSSRR
ncbi:hypothetical protein GCM10009838_10680 [Catenulispora subtropica]|uniref:Uncharacterized protein n=2 Tax=Catenulispora subtropica TaxID=450798 RepID=A0ABP5C3N9_9ACTN